MVPPMSRKISGMNITTNPNAFSAMPLSFSLRPANFSFSTSSRTKDFTTRIAFRSSCTTRFRSSVAPCRAVKNGPTFRSTSTTPSTSSGITTRNTWLSRVLMTSAITRAVTSITGARTSIRMPIIRVICRLFTSLVSRVISDAVEKCSMLAKENFCTCRYSAARRLAPKPMPALEASTAAPTPRARDTRAMTTIFSPAIRI